MPKIEVSEDRCSLSVTDGDASRLVAKMSTEEVEHTLVALGVARQGMLPGIPDEWPLAQRQLCTVHRAACGVETEPFGEAVMHVKHPHYGWLHFIFSKEDARRIGAALIDCAEAPAAAVSA